MSTAYESICNQQKWWACQRGIRFDEDGDTLSLDDNQFLPLLPEVRKEFKAGKGDELGAAGIRGKMRALHSSSALVVNIFQYWANRDVSEIASACGAPHGMTRMHFESLSNYSRWDSASSGCRVFGRLAETTCDRVKIHGALRSPY